MLNLVTAPPKSVMSRLFELVKRGMGLALDREPVETPPPTVFVEAAAPRCQEFDRRFDIGQDKLGRLVSMTEEQLRQHVLVTGGSGFGKSRFITKLLLDHLDQNEGATLVDPGGDTAEDVLGYIARRYAETGDEQLLKRVHYVELSPFCVPRLDPFRLHLPKPVHPELWDNVFRAWQHARVQRVNHSFQRKQGVDNFEGMPRLERMMTNVMLGVSTEYKKKRLALQDAMILINPLDKRQAEVFARLRDGLPREVVADLEAIQGMRRVEDIRKETESTLNRLRSLLSPLLQAAFGQPGSEHVLDIHEIVRKRHLLLVNLRETAFFSHDQKLALGGLFIQDIIAAMQLMPREMRTGHTLVLEEAGELLGEDLNRAAGAMRKTGLRFVFCGQDLSTFIKGDLDMRPKMVSQCSNKVCFNMAWPDDAALMARVILSGNFDFTPLELESDRHGGYEHSIVPELSINTKQDESESETTGSAQSSTQSVSKTQTGSWQKNWQKSESWGANESSSVTNGQSDNWSSGASLTRQPIMVHGKEIGRIDVPSVQHGQGGSRQQSFTNGSGSSKGGSEAEGGGEGFSLGESIGDARSVSEHEARTQGRTKGWGASLSFKLQTLAKIVRVVQKTGKLVKAVADQLEQFAAGIMTLARREAVVKLVGVKEGVKLTTCEVKDPYESPVSLIRAVEYMKRKMMEVHKYLFVPSLDPKVDEERLIAFLGEERSEQPVVADEPAPVKNGEANGHTRNGHANDVPKHGPAKAARGEENPYGN